VPKVLKSNRYGVIVVMLGANDRQTIRSGSARLAFGTPELALRVQGAGRCAAGPAHGLWRADRLGGAAAHAGSRLLRSHQGHHGPPARARGRAAWASPISGRSSSGPDGAYTDVVPDRYGLTRIRGRDGISFFKAGNNRMGQFVSATIEADAAAGDEPPPAVEPAAPQARLPEAPLFGQAMMDEAAYTVHSEGVTVNAMLLAGLGLDADAALRTLREIAPKGSAADALFPRGAAPPAPPVAVDDLSAPPNP